MSALDTPFSNALYADPSAPAKAPSDPSAGQIPGLRATVAQGSGQIPGLRPLDTMIADPTLANLNEQSAQRAAQATALQGQQQEQQQKAFQFAHQQAQIAANNEMTQAGGHPELAGKAWQETPQDYRDAMSARYPMLAAELPEIHNKTQTTLTGRLVGPNILPGETASADVNGAKITGILPTGQNGVGYDQLPPHLQRMVDMVGTYQMPQPTRGGMPEAQRAMVLNGLTDKYGPDSEQPYNAAEFPARQAALKDFKSGQSAKTINNLQTAVGHVLDLKNAGDQLGNTNTLPGITNPAANAIGGIVNSKTQANLTRFNQTADALASELAKVYGNSASTIAGIHEWRKNLNADLSPDAQNAAIDQALELLYAKVGALQDQWQQGVKGTRTIPFIKGKAAQALQELGKRGSLGAHAMLAMDPLAGQEGPQEQPQPGAGNVAQGQQSAQSPQVGEVRKGYRFKGGNPAQQSSWEPVQ